MPATIKRSDYAAMFGPTTGAGARGRRRDIAAASAVRVEPGQRRDVQLIEIGGDRKVFGFSQQVMGQSMRDSLPSAPGSLR